MEISDVAGLGVPTAQKSLIPANCGCCKGFAHSEDRSGEKRVECCSVERDDRAVNPKSSCCSRRPLLPSRENECDEEVAFRRRGGDAAKPRDRLRMLRWDSQIHDAVRRGRSVCHA